MAQKFKKGDEVRLIQPEIKGTVETLQIVDSDVQFVVTYINAKGEEHTRCFSEDQLELVSTEPA